MSNIKILDFSNQTVTPDLINEVGGFKNIEAWQAEGFRHFIFDFSKITYLEGIERIPIIMLTIKQSIRQLQGKSIVVKPQGFLDLFGMVLEQTINSGDDDGFKWDFVDSLEEAQNLIT